MVDNINGNVLVGQAGRKHDASHHVAWVRINPDYLILVDEIPDWSNDKGWMLHDKMQ